MSDESSAFLPRSPGPRCIYLNREGRENARKQAPVSLPHTWLRPSAYITLALLVPLQPSSPLRPHPAPYSIVSGQPATIFSREQSPVALRNTEGTELGQTTSQRPPLSDEPLDVDVIGIDADDGPTTDLPRGSGSAPGIDWDCVRNLDEMILAIRDQGMG